MLLYLVKLNSTFVDKVGDYTDFIGNGYSPVNEKRQKELATAYAQQAAERTLINEAFEAQLDELTVQLTAAGAKGNVANNFRKIMGQVAYTYNPYDPTAYLRKHPLRVVGVDSNGKVQLDDNGRTIVANAGDQAGTVTAPQQNNTQQQGLDFFDKLALDNVDNWLSGNDYSSGIMQSTTDQYDSASITEAFKARGYYDPDTGGINAVRVREITNKGGWRPEYAQEAVQRDSGYNDPVAVFTSATINDGKNLVIVLSLKDKNNANFLVPVRFDEQVIDGARQYAANIMTSAYGKDERIKIKDLKTNKASYKFIPRPEWFKEQIDANRTKYINKKKLRDLSNAEHLLAPMVGKIEKLQSSSSIVTENDLVKLKEQNPGYYQEKTTTTKGFFNPTEGIIGLFKGADASTVIHEGGHFFVENLINDVLSGDCTQQQQQDAAALMDYCGITLEQWQVLN